VTERGEPLSYWGGHMVVRRARTRSGIARLHAHLFRHGMAQYAADKGADIGTVQTLLATRRQPWLVATLAEPWIARARS
jgi:site-specific recombinase XerD